MVGAQYGTYLMCNLAAFSTISIWSMTVEGSAATRVAFPSTVNAYRPADPGERLPRGGQSATCSVFVHSGSFQCALHLVIHRRGICLLQGGSAETELHLFAVHPGSFSHHFRLVIHRCGICLHQGGSAGRCRRLRTCWPAR